MNSTRPPRLATWIWKHFGCGPDTDAVLGDLIERYAQGKSRTWYWRQVLTGLPMSLGKDLWSHKLVAVRAVLTGWAMFFSFAAWIRPVIGRLLFPNPGIQSPLLIGGVPFDAVFSYNFAASVTLLFAAGAVSGWTIGRFHRSCRKTAVFAYAASFLLIDAILFGPFLFLGATLFLYVASVTAGVLTGGGIFRKIPVPPVTS